MINVNVSGSSSAEYKQRMAAARTALKENGVAMRQVAAFLDQWVQKNIITEGGKVGGWERFKYGGRWTGKGESRRLDMSAKLLRDTTALQHSFLPFVRDGVAGIGSDLPYSKAHEDGLPSRNLPQRRLLPKKEEVAIDVKQILDSWVKIQFKRMGLA